MAFWAALVALVVSIFPFGMAIVIACIFGFVFSNYYRNKQMADDLQMIKQKLGISEPAQESGMDEESDLEGELDEELEEDPGEGEEPPRAARRGAAHPRKTGEPYLSDEEIERELDEWLERTEARQREKEAKKSEDGDKPGMT